MGDFNIKFHIKDNIDTREFLSLSASYGLTSTISEYTHITAQSSSCIDNIFTNLTDYYSVSNVELSLSDHKAQIISLGKKMRNTVNNKPKVVIKNNFTNVHVIFLWYQLKFIS